MMYANEYDLNRYLELFGDVEETPNLRIVAVAVANLADWANYNSDGWAYWPKPCRSAVVALKTLEEAERAYLRGAPRVDIEDADVTAALRPMKAFLTRQGLSKDEGLALLSRPVGAWL